MMNRFIKYPVSMLSLSPLFDRMLLLRAVVALVLLLCCIIDPIEAQSSVSLLSSSSNSTTTNNNGTKTQCSTSCEPNGICALETKGCYQPPFDDNNNNSTTGSTATTRSIDSSSLLEECQYRCQCNVGYVGKDCSIQMEQCDGPFPPSMKQLFGIPDDDDDSNVVCYNGGTCIEVIEDNTSTATQRSSSFGSSSGSTSTYYKCDCSSSSSASLSLSNTTTSIDILGGLQCQYTDAISCVRNQEFSSTNYCVNGGMCLQYVDSDNVTMLPCDCPNKKYEGRHCQYIYGTAPQSELDYVRNQLLLEEQRIENITNINSNATTNNNLTTTTITKNTTSTGNSTTNDKQKQGDDSNSTESQQQQPKQNDSNSTSSSLGGIVHNYCSFINIVRYCFVFYILYRIEMIISI